MHKVFENQIYLHPNIGSQKLLKKLNKICFRTKNITIIALN